MQNVSIPVASHGLHRHKLNFPYLGTFNFTDLCPVFYQPLEKGESVSINKGSFSRLMPIKNPAFATGRYVFKSFFVPHKYVFRPWYNFIEGTPFVYADGSIALPETECYTRHEYLTMALQGFVGDETDPETMGVNTLFVEHTVPNPNDDFFIYDNGSVTRTWKCTALGSRVIKVFASLGMMPSFDLQDLEPVNLLPFFSYLKIVIDHYFPRQFYNSGVCAALRGAIRPEKGEYNSSDLQLILQYSRYWTRGFYDSAITDNAFQNPTGPNAPFTDISIPDIAGNYPVVLPSESARAYQTTGVNIDNFTNPNGTPSTQVGTTYPNNGLNGPLSKLNQFILDALKSMTLWAKRRQLSGGRLLERLLVARGIKLDNDDTNIPYYLGQSTMEIEVDAVENNSNTNLGELAGKGTAAAKNIKFKCTAQDDGIFMIVCYVQPDAVLPVYNDQYNSRYQMLDFYHPEYDKLGAEAVPARTFGLTCNGALNSRLRNRVFGFLNRYWGDVAERPRLVGDFMLTSRGARELASYHTFRSANWFGEGITDLYDSISLDFLSQASDGGQYNRLFLDTVSDHMQLFIRWRVTLKKHKLPLGDSYDWDDDEANERVSVLMSGNSN